MAEYIEKQKLIEELDDKYSLGDIGRMEHDIIVNALLYAKPADVRPVVRGRWEEDCAGAAVCPVCGEYAFETSTHHLCGWFPNYCPNCGADMRG